MKSMLVTFILFLIFVIGMPVLLKAKDYPKNKIIFADNFSDYKIGEQPWEDLSVGSDYIRVVKAKNAIEGKALLIKTSLNTEHISLKAYFNTDATKFVIEFAYKTLSKGEYKSGFNFYFRNEDKDQKGLMHGQIYSDRVSWKKNENSLKVKNFRSCELPGLDGWNRIRIKANIENNEADIYLNDMKVPYLFSQSFEESFVEPGKYSIQLSFYGCKDGIKTYPEILFDDFKVLVEKV